MAALSEKDKEAKSYYTLISDNLEIAKGEFTPEEYKAVRKYAERLRKRIIFNNGLDDLPELPD